MRRTQGTRAFAIAMTSLLLLMVLGARAFVHSWTRALLYGSAVFAALLVLSVWSRRAEARKLERQYGRITLRGPLLIFEEPREEASSVHAAAMRELRYAYNVYGWSGANTWKLVYDVEQVRKETSISESSGDHLVAPLRAWCVRNLRGFDGGMFDRLAWSLGDDESKDIVVWSKRHT